MAIGESRDASTEELTYQCKQVVAGLALVRLELDPPPDHLDALRRAIGCIADLADRAGCDTENWDRDCTAIAVEMRRLRI